jgi:hypothetical protein
MEIYQPGVSGTNVYLLSKISKSGPGQHSVYSVGQPTCMYTDQLANSYTEGSAKLYRERFANSYTEGMADLYTEGLANLCKVGPAY